MLSPIEQIKDRIDIVDLVGAYIKLDRAGRNFKARCPFHNEKTPSFMVSPERQSFYCFGCQAKGDIFSFVEKFEGLEFKDALKLLASRAGVELKRQSKEEEQRSDRLYRALEEATLMYEEFLGGAKEQMDYISSRGISDATCKKWRLGWAPNDWRVLYERMQSREYSDDELFAVGLIKPGTGGRRPYDVFRGRIVFPIFDISGRTIAFSGRIYNDDGKSPKYVNTPETELYKKSEVLYGLHEAKAYIRKVDYTVLVEGQIDLVLSHQAGVTNSVATSGTALTEAHLKRMQKLSNRIIMAFDGDKAGKAAVLRSGELALSIGMEVKVAILPAGEDPASIIAKSADKWKDILKSSVNLVEFAIDEAISVAKGKKNEKVELVRQINRLVLPLLSSVRSEMLKDEMIAVSAKKAGIAEKSFRADFEKFSSGLRSKPRDGQSDPIRTIVLSPEEMIAGIVCMGEAARETGGIKSDKVGTNKQRLIENSYYSDEIKRRAQDLLGAEALEQIIDNGRYDKNTLVFETEARLADTNIAKAAAELLRRIEKTILEKKLLEAANRLDKAKEGDERDKLRQEAKEISKRISEINLNKNEKTS